VVLLFEAGVILLFETPGGCGVFFEALGFVF
jgi:hypothetical protein